MSTSVAGPGSDTTVGGSESEGESGELLLWDKAQRTALDELIELYAAEQEVTVERVEQDIDNYDTLLRLAMSSDDPPDVLQVTFGWRGMGPLVQGEALHPLNDYADQYGWWDHLGNQAESLSFSGDGCQWGGENLYAVDVVGSLQGVYYNKAKLADLGIEPPDSFDSFEESLASAQAGGEIPIMLGDADTGHSNRVFYPILNTLITPAEFQAWSLGEEGASFAFDGATVEAAEIFQQWEERGYYVDGYSGIAYQDAITRFVDGEGVYLFDGSWANPNLLELGDDLGFMLLRRSDGSVPAVTGSYDSPLGIASRSENKDLAAEFIDFLISAEAADYYVAAGELVDPNSGVEVPSDGSTGQIYEAWGEAVNNDALVHYRNWAATGIGDPITAGLQELLADRTTPEDFVDQVQSYYEDFQEELDASC